MNELAIHEAFLSKYSKVIKIIPHEVQYDFFKDPKEVEYETLIVEIEDIRDSTNRVRKKLFAENGSMKLRLQELEEKLRYIEKGICKGDLCIK